MNNYINKTVKDFITENLEQVIHLMTPVGYVDLNPIQNRQLLAGSMINAHPGCSGFRVEIPAKYILSQIIGDCKIKRNQFYLLTYTKDTH